jgi:hypothetical protein
VNRSSEYISPSIGAPQVHYTETIIHSIGSAHRDQ